MVARFKHPVPTLRWAVEVGELVHSLRSALDNLAWDLALITTRKPPRSTAFPIHTSEANFKKDAHRQIRAWPVGAENSSGVLAWGFAPA